MQISTIESIWSVVSWIILLVGTIGIFLNLCGIWFLIKRLNKKTVFSNLLLVLAVLDTIFLASTTLSYSLHNLSATYLQHVFPYVYPYTFPLTLSSQMGSTSLTVCLALERYLAIVKPLFREKYTSLKQAKTFAIPSIIFSILFNFITWFWFRTSDMNCKHLTYKTSVLHYCKESVNITMDDNYEKVLDSRTMIYYCQEMLNDTIIPYNNTNLVGSEVVRTCWDLAPYANILIGICLPLIILIVLSIFLHNGLKKHRISKTGGDAVELKQTEQRMSRIGFIIVIIFILCNSVRAVENMMETCWKSLKHPFPLWVPLIRALAYSLLIINSSINFPVYFLHSGRASKKLPRFMSHKRTCSTKANILSSSPNTPVLLKMEVYEVMKPSFNGPTKK